MEPWQGNQYLSDFRREQGITIPMPEVSSILSSTPEPLHVVAAYTRMLEKKLGIRIAPHGAVDIQTRVAPDQQDSKWLVVKGPGIPDILGCNSVDATIDAEFTPFDTLVDLITTARGVICPPGMIPHMSAALPGSEKRRVIVLSDHGQDHFNRSYKGHVEICFKHWDNENKLGKHISDIIGPLFSRQDLAKAIP